MTMKITLCILLVMAVVVGGCADFRNPLAVSPPRPWTTSTYEDENQKLTQRAETLREAAPFMSGAEDLDLFEVLIKEPDPEPMEPGREGPHAANRNSRSAFSYMIVKSGSVDSQELTTPLTTSLYVSLLNKYVQDRRTQIDKLCLDYFSTLDDVAGSSRFAQTEINSIGDFAAVVMGITGSPAEHLAILAGAQALTNDSFDATSAMLLLSPPPSVVFELVKSRQRALTATVVEGFTEFGPAELFVSRYAATCMPVGIRAIVTETISSEAADASPESPRQSVGLVLIRAALNEGLADDQKVGELTVRDAALVVWYLSLPACDHSCPSGSDQEYIQTSLAAPIWRAMQDSADKTKMRNLINQAVANAPAVTTQRGELQAAREAEKRDTTIRSLETRLATAERQITTANNAAEAAQGRADAAKEAQGQVRGQLQGELQVVRDRLDSVCRAVAASAAAAVAAGTPAPPPVEGCPVT